MCVRLLWRAGALAVVAGAAGRDHVHPVVLAVAGEGHDVFARQVFFVKVPAAVGTHIAVAGKELAVGQAGLELERIDAGHALGADDAVDSDHRLLTRDGVVPAPEPGNLGTRFPAHFPGGVMNDRLLQRNPRLGQPLG